MWKLQLICDIGSKFKPEKPGELGRLPGGLVFTGAEFLRCTAEPRRARGTDWAEWAERLLDISGVRFETRHESQMEQLGVGSLIKLIDKKEKKNSKLIIN